MKNYKIKTSFISSRWPKASANKTGIFSMINLMLDNKNSRPDIRKNKFRKQKINCSPKTLTDSTGSKSQNCYGMETRQNHSYIFFAIPLLLLLFYYFKSIHVKRLTF